MNGGIYAKHGGKHTEATHIVRCAGLLCITMKEGPVLMLNNDQKQRETPRGFSDGSTYKSGCAKKDSESE